MKPTIRDAARHLLEGANIPLGKINALVAWDEGGPLIRLWVDHEYLYRTQNLPHHIDGYRVEVSERPMHVSY